MRVRLVDPDRDRFQARVCGDHAVLGVARVLERDPFGADGREGVAHQAEALGVAVGNA